MITITNVKLYDGSHKDLHFPHSIRKIFDGKGLLALPALIDTHAQFRSPLQESENYWVDGGRAALRGGVTTVFDRSDVVPATITLSRLKEKRAIILDQLKMANIPLRYEFYFAVNKSHFDEIHKVGKEAVSLQIFMGVSASHLLMDDDSSLHAAFSLAHQFNLIITIKKDYQTTENISAIEKAIFLSELYQVRLYILQINNSLEIDLIHAAKQKKLPVYAETTIADLFSADNENQSLWNAVKEGIIDTIGSGYDNGLSFFASIETIMPLLYTAVREGKLSLSRLIELTSVQARKLFGLAQHDDWVFIDTENPKAMEERMLIGWPKYVTVRSQFCEVDSI